MQTDLPTTRQLTSSQTAARRRSSLRTVGRSVLLAALLVGLLPGAALPALAQADVVLFPTPTATVPGVVLPTVTPTPPDDSVAASAAISGAGDDGALAFVPGELLMGVRESAVAEVSARMGEVLAGGAATTGVSPAAVTLIDGSTGCNRSDDLVTQRLAVPVGSEFDVAMQLAAIPGVVYVEPNGLVYTADGGLAGNIKQAAPPAGFPINDPDYAQQWHHQRIGMSRAWQLAFDAELFAEQGDQVLVSIVDTGIDDSHPDLVERVGEVVNYYPDEANVDGYGHGTHVAGLVGAALNNATGVVGAAPHVMIEGRKVLRSSGTGTIDEVARGICDAANAGAAIINLSLETASHFITLQDAVQYATEKGSLLIVAAGNGRCTTTPCPVSYPARYPETLAVAALTIDDLRATYSNVGEELDIAAPGGLSSGYIWSTWSAAAREMCLYPDIDENAAAPYYCGRWGTSQATAIVSGVAALLLSLEPTLTMTDVRSLLIDTATPLAQPAAEVGAGKLNAEAAVRALLAPALEADTASIVVDAVNMQDPYTQTIRFENPSLQPITWTATLDLRSASGDDVSAAPAITLNGGVSAVEGVASLGTPAFLTLQINPALVRDGMTASLHVEAKDAAGTDYAESVELSTPALWLPIVRRAANTGSAVDALAPPAFEWLEPASPVDRTLYAMDGLTYTLVSLPFPIKVDGEQFSDLRIYADGFVALPDAITNGAPVPSNLAKNSCLPATAYPAQAVYGWWADLNPAAPGASVSTFAVNGRFVIEFNDVPAVNADQPYKVSFQIVLGSSGAVQLNYLDAPAFVGRPESVTVGVEATAGRFWSQIACVTPTQVFGVLPAAGQTILIRPDEIF